MRMLTLAFSTLVVIAASAKSSSAQQYKCKTPIAPVSQATPEDLIKSGEIKVTGDVADAARLINLLDRYVPARTAVIPPAAFYHL